MPDSKRLVVISGASSGIGLAAAHALAARGFRVLAGARRPQAPPELDGDGIEWMSLDITEAADVERLADRVGSTGTRLHALVNNAGIAVNAPVEAIPLVDWRRQFEVNFFGHVAVTQALLPALLETGGRVINVSSIGGRVAGPTFGAYAASKFALEAMTDALRREVRRLGVEVIAIEPGGVATPIWAKGVAQAEQLVAAMNAQQSIRYQDLIEAVSRQAGRTSQAGMTPADVARVIADAIEAPRPRARYLVGRDAKLMARLAWLLPDRALDALIARRLGLQRADGRVASGTAA